MADKTYVTFAGTVQKFGDKPIVRTFDANGTRGHSFTIRAAGSQTLIGVTLWEPDFAEFVPHITKGMFLAGEGSYSENTKDGVTYRSVSVISLNAVAPVKQAPREVVNQPTGGQQTAAPSGAPTF